VKKILSEMGKTLSEQSVSRLIGMKQQSNLFRIQAFNGLLPLQELAKPAEQRMRSMRLGQSRSERQCVYQSMKRRPLSQRGG
jgi:hypothetical protein